MNEWIAVKDKLPENGERVLIFEDGDIFTSEYRRMETNYSPGYIDTWDSKSEYNYEHYPSHWMSLPKSPEDI